MGERNSVPEYEPAAEVIVVTVVPADYLISHVSSVFPPIETQTLSDGNNVADEEFGNIHMVRDSGVHVAEEAIGSRNFRNSGARDQVEAEAELFRFADR